MCDTRGSSLNGLHPESAGNLCAYSVSQDNSRRTPLANLVQPPLALILLD